MKKSTGICLFSGSALVLTGAIVLAAYTQRETKTDPPSAYIAESEETELSEFTEIMAIQEPYLYIVKPLNGLLAVYEADGCTLWFETDIRTADLEKELMERLTEGLPFFDDEALYSFLESYSS